MRPRRRSRSSGRQLVRDLIPCSEKVRFHSSGTEATMMAVRMARAYTGRTKLVKFRDHFHGWNDYVRSHEPAAGGIPAETASTVISIEPNDIGLVERTLEGDKDVAAVIVEPTGAHMGDTPLRPSFLGELREVTERYGVVLIFDEVVTGFRMSKGGAQGLYGVTPDMCTLAKILGGGLPGGAVTGKAEIIDMIQLRDEPGFNSASRIGHNGTFNANPLSAAAGQKALELVKTQPINANADRAAARLRDGLNGAAEPDGDHGHGDGRGLGGLPEAGRGGGPARRRGRADRGAGADGVGPGEEGPAHAGDVQPRGGRRAAVPGERDPLGRRHRPDGGGSGPGARGHAGAGASLGAAPDPGGEERPHPPR